MSSRRDLDVAHLEQLLQESEKRAELQRQRADDAEQRHRQEADERVELERRRAEDERRNRLEADERVELERRRAEDERRNRLEAEKKTRPTTFKEYIRACHTLLSKPLRIQRDRSLSTQGSITSPKDKPCPTLLKPWTDFPKQQQQLFERMHEYIPQDKPLFSSTQYLTELGHKLCNRPLASEQDLEIYQRLAIEEPTTDIISYLQQVEEARREFNIGGGIIFENHANTLSNSTEEVQQSLQDLCILSKGQALSSNPKPRNADQICVYKEADGKHSLCMVVEYKPSHKLSIFNLRAGLRRASKGSMNIPEDVINQITIPTDPQEKFVYNSEWLVVAALTQTYSYMIESGLEYSYLVTAEAFVFLWVKENEPHTLYYHLAEPNVEAEAQDKIDSLLCSSAVSQTLTFCLMALHSKPRSQSWRIHTLNTADRAVIDHKAVLRQIPDEEKDLTPPPSVFHARIQPFQRSPIMLRPRKSGKVRNSCRSTDEQVHKEDPGSPSGSSDESSDVDTPSKPSDHTAPSKVRQAHATKTSQAADERDVRQRQYCTQACLLGLVHKRPLDESCPNFFTHTVHRTSNRHALDQKTLAQHMQHQLEEDLDNGCEPLGKQGARGALFKLTLFSHGYTFVAKGTVEAFIQKLEHEGRVYRHLNKVQGELIPVYLGNISLINPYFLDFGVRIVHMLLMSWAGEQAQNDLMSRMSLDVRVETARAVTKLRECGVEHGDIRPPNVLWNPEIRKVVLVDFDRSEILRGVSAHQETSANRNRKHLHLHPAAPCGRLCNQLFISPVKC